MGWSLLQGRAEHVSIVTFPIDPVRLRGIVPVGTEVDSLDKETVFLSVVGVRFSESRLLGLPIPFGRCYDQINLRFYVRRWMGDGWRRGVVFVRELVPVSPLLSAGHLLYGDAYERLPVTSRIRPAVPAAHRPGRAIYRWRTGHDEIHRLAVDFGGEPRLPAAGSDEEFLVDRHWGYLAPHVDVTREYRIDHPPWRVFPEAQARLSPGVAALFGDRFSHALDCTPVNVLVAEGSRMEVHRPVTLPPLAPARPAFV
ncbi:MAG TPA: DUF2071 domain-containing protein [Kofleriaceae bacterium]|nr:DUF2071 domain-containing protein [Kofleriaceae bacterium]